MGNINDTSFRNMLAERFLDCDTSVEEERELASFYQECTRNGCIPEGEEDICQLVTATVKCHDGKCHGDEMTSRPRRKPWQWAAAACAAGIAVAGVAFALATHQGSAPALADADTSAVQPTCTTSHGQANDTDTQAMASVTAKAGVPAMPNKDKMPIRTAAEATTMPTTAATVATRKQKQSATPSSADISSVCHAAINSFHDATDISIERKGNALLLSTANDDGTCRRYVVDENAKGQVTLIEI